MLEPIRETGNRMSLATPEPVFDAALETGKIVVPKRKIGDCAAEQPTTYPTTWPPEVEAALKRRGDQPIRVFADGTFGASRRTPQRRPSARAVRR